VRVLERGSQYDGRWKFEAWLFTIARNLVLDWHRRKKPESFESLRGPEEDAPAFDVRDEKSVTPLESVLSNEQREGVQHIAGQDSCSVSRSAGAAISGRDAARRDFRRLEYADFRP